MCVLAMRLLCSIRPFLSTRNHLGVIMVLSGSSLEEGNFSCHEASHFIGDFDNERSGESRADFLQTEKMADYYLRTPSGGGQYGAVDQEAENR